MTLKRYRYGLSKHTVFFFTYHNVLISRDDVRIEYELRAHQLFNIPLSAVTVDELLAQLLLVPSQETETKVVLCG